MKTVYSRFCKWRDDGTLQTMFHALRADADDEKLSIDSTLVKAHQHSVGTKKGRQDTKPAIRLGKAAVGTPPRSGRPWKSGLPLALSREHP